MATEQPKNDPLRSVFPDNDPRQPTFDSDPEILERIVEEFTARLRAGQHPAIADFQNQYPAFKDEIEDLLSSVAMIEQLKGESEPKPNSKKLLDKVSHLTRIGNYKIIREVGRGGMGVVFSAVHDSLGRRVAIKVMPTPLVNGEKYIERFKQEAQSAARLHHTNIVSVFGVGETEDFHYYVMDFVDGQSLNDVIFGIGQNRAGTTKLAASTQITSSDSQTNDDFALTESHVFTPHTDAKTSAADQSGSYRQSVAQQLTLNTDHPKHFRWAARIGASIADALAYAHSTGILHRDIKPANMMLSRNGVVWITDFGLAKDHANELNLTKTGDVIGTPQYLAPESLEGKYDQRSETYCLGLTLYELVTLKPAYPAGSTAEVIRAIATKSPVSPRKINRNIPIDLSTIIDKSLSRDPGLRYQSASELRSDLLAFVEDRAISARRPLFLEKVIRWSRRNPLPAALSAISALLLVLVAMASTIGYLATTDALNKEAEKSTRLAAQQLATEQARKTAESNFEQMKAQYDRAEANITITIEAFDEMFKQVISRGAAPTAELDIDGFREVSGIESSITSEDADFLSKLLSFYEQFAALNADNERLQSESAKAFRRVGNIYQLVGEMPASVAAYEKSINLYQNIWEESPATKENLLTLVKTQNELSAASRKNGHSLDAHEWNKKSLELLEDSPLSISDPDVRLELARTLSVLGFNMFRLMGVTNISPTPGQSRNGMIPRTNNDSNANAKLNRTNGLSTPPKKPSPILSEIWKNGKRGLDRRNKQLTEQAIEIMDDLIIESPDNAEYRSVRATCYCVLASARIGFDRESGLRMRDKAIQEIDSLVAAYPDNAEYRYLLALACALGGSDVHQDDVALIERSLEITKKLISQFPKLLDYHHLFASLKIKIAGYHLVKKETEAAYQELQMAKSSIDVLLEHTPSDKSFYRTMLALTNELQQLAKSYDEQGQKRMAAEVNQLNRQVRTNMRSKVISRGN